MLRRSLLLTHASILVLLLNLFSVTPAHAANCDGLPVTGGVLPAGDYTLLDDCVTTATLEIATGTTVTINGDGFALDGNDTHRVLRVNENATLNIDNVIVRNGRARVPEVAGGIINSGTLTITNSTITNNFSGYGGGIDSSTVYSGSLTLINTIVTNNTVRYGGGGINNGGTMTIIDSEISGNTATRGGGLISSLSRVNITNSTISGNTATDYGGGIVAWTGSVNITDSTISGNSATNRAGGIASLTYLTLTNSIVSGNLAGDGGGIYYQGFPLTVIGSTISGNTATQNGGGIRAYLGLGMSLSDSLISDNVANGLGNGIFTEVQLFESTGTTYLNNDCVGTIDDLGGNTRDAVSVGCPNAIINHGIAVSAPVMNPIAENTSTTFTVNLTSNPRADVNIAVSSNDGTECVVSPTLLTLNASTLNATVTITGVGDLTIDGDQPCTAILAPASSSDSNYSGRDADDVTVMVNDIDTPTGSITVGAPTANPISENGGTATFAVTLDTVPTANVNIAVSSSDATACTVAPAMLTLNAGMLTDTVTVTGVDDVAVDGDQACTVVLAPATSGDLNYTGFDADDVALTVSDDETPGITVSAPSANPITETDATTFTVTLNTIPTDDVTINVTTSDATECTIAPATLVLNAGTMTYMVTITGVDDATVDGDQPCTAILAPATSGDGDYAGRDAADVIVTVADSNTAPPSAGGATISVIQEDDGDGSPYTSVLIVTLPQAPNAGEVVTVTIADVPAGLLIAPNPIVFNESNWSTPARILVIADQFIHGDYTVTLVANVASNGAIYGATAPIPFSIALALQVPPSLNEWNATADENRAHAWGVPDNAYGTIHMWQGAWQYNPGGIPQELIDYGVLFAVDVWMLTQDGQPQFDFGEGYEAICLQGIGRMIFFDATTSPRQMTEILPVTFEDGYTCGWIPNAGTLVLIEPE